MQVDLSVPKARLSALSPLRALIVAFAAVFLAGSADAQRPVPIGSTASSGPWSTTPIEGSTAGHQRWIVHFVARSFDLSALAALLDPSAPPATQAQVAAVIQGYEAKTLQDRVAFSTALTQLGGQITDNWWIINACCVEVPGSKVSSLAQVAGVQRLEPDLYAYPNHAVSSGSLRSALAPMIEATGASGHNVVAAHAAGYTGSGGRPAGQPMSIAVLDTELETYMVSAPAGVRHHAVMRAGGSPNGATRVLHDVTMPRAGNFTAAGLPPFDHGVSVAACAAGSATSSPGSAAGQAPSADIVSVNVAADYTTGQSSWSALTNAWQWTLANRVQYNIVVVVNSYGGLPDPLAATQAALDTCAAVGDVLIVVSCGNENWRAWSSEYSQYALNGLAVAAANAGSRMLTSFSSQGPLTGAITNYRVPPGYEREWPDITATGAAQVLPHQHDEAQYTVKPGTSFAAPHVAGAGYLYRAGHDSTVSSTRSALMAKAALLVTSESIAAQNGSANIASRSGSGFLRTDWLTARANALGLSVQEYRPTSTVIPRRSMSVTQGQSYSVAIAWNRTDFGSNPDWVDLDLKIYDSANNVIAESASFVSTPGNGTRRAWERVTFTAAASGVVDIAVQATHVPAGTSIRYAQAQFMLPTAKRARTSDIAPNMNQNCLTTGWADHSSWDRDTANLPGAELPKSFTNGDCAGTNCIYFEYGAGERAFDIAHVRVAGEETLKFRFWVEASRAGLLDCHIRDGVVNPQTQKREPGNLILGQGKLRVTNGAGYMYGEVHHSDHLSHSPEFLVITFPPKMKWWDARFVYWTQWTNPPWCYPNGMGGCNWNSIGPMHYYTRAPGFPHYGWATSGVRRSSPNQWVEIAQFRFAFTWQATGSRAVDLDILGMPSLGATSKISLRGCSAGASVAFLNIGFTPIAPSQFGSCWALVRSDSILPMVTDTEGWASTDIPVPNSVALAGYGIDFQAVVTDTSNNGIRSSNAKRAVIGF